MAAAHTQSRATRRICVLRATGWIPRRRLAGRPGGCRFCVHPILPAAREPWMTTPDGTTGAPRTGPELARGKAPGWGAPGWGAALALAGAIFASLLALAGRTTLWDRDEPRFAQATVE